MGQIKIPKKYKKFFIKNYKPSKKNKKAWKEYKTYKKTYNKQFKAYNKYMKKLMKKLVKNHWTFNVNKDFRYKLKLTKKNIILKFRCKGYRTIKVKA